MNEFSLPFRTSTPSSSALVYYRKITEIMGTARGKAGAWTNRNSA